MERGRSTCTTIRRRWAGPSSSASARCPGRRWRWRPGTSASGWSSLLKRSPRTQRGRSSRSKSFAIRRWGTSRPCPSIGWASCLRCPDSAGWRVSSGRPPVRWPCSCRPGDRSGWPGRPRPSRTNRARTGPPSRPWPLSAPACCSCRATPGSICRCQSRSVRAGLAGSLRRRRDPPDRGCCSRPRNGRTRHSCYGATPRARGRTVRSVFPLIRCGRAPGPRAGSCSLPTPRRMGRRSRSGTRGRGTSSGWPICRYRKRRGSSLGCRTVRG